ncbi:MAG: rhamnulose-1-phosphate aldolase [Eubacteriales bacterium]|nr:rhamnulose-1-phosphate aldolase [Eubacteriales bacterium]
MKITDTKVLQRFVRMCDDGWQQGWHERNGGNLTYRMTSGEVDACRPFFKPEAGEWQAMGVCAPELAGEFFLSTGSGKYMRNVSLEPQNTLCMLEINQAGDSWRVVWGLEQGGRPTSEFPSHFLNHSVRKAATDGACRVIYHAHPANVIAMTYILPLTARDFTRALWQSATECPVVFPGGVGVVPWMVPGGADIARATSKLMREYDAAVWAHHGLFVSGPDFDTTFGLMHTIEKAAEIYMKVLSSGRPVLQTITDADLQAIADEFGVTLRKEFLE